MIIVDSDGIFVGISKKNFQETLLIPVHPVARGKEKEIINEVLHRHFKKVQKIKSADKGSFLQWLQGMLFALCAWNSGPVYGTDIAQSVVDIGIDFPFPIDLSPASSREGISEVQQALDHFEADPQLCLYKESCLTSWYLIGV